MKHILAFIIIMLGTTSSWVFCQGVNTDFIVSFCGVLNGGTLTKEEFAACDSLTLYTSDPDCADARIISFTINRSGPWGDCMTNNYTNKIDARNQALLNSFDLGANFWIEDINVMCDSVVWKAPLLRLSFCAPRICLFYDPQSVNHNICLLGDTTLVRKIGRGVRYGSTWMPKKNFLKNDYLFIYNNELDTSSWSKISRSLQIVKYTCTITYKTGANKAPLKLTVEGDQISEEIKTAVRKSKDIDYLQINAIKARDASGNKIDIMGLYLRFEDESIFYEDDDL